MTQRHKPGRGSQLTPEERLEVQRMSIADGLSNSEIARRTGRDRGTIATVLASDDAKELKRKFQSEQHDAALSLLRDGRVPAATEWVSAIGIAAQKGDHRPAKDLLLHTGVIQPVTADNGPRVAVQINLHGGPEPLSLVANASPITSVITIGTEPSGETSALPALAEGVPGASAKRSNVEATPPRPMATQNFAISKCSPSDSGNSCGIAAPVTLEESDGD
jgi:hypothetical protein